MRMNLIALTLSVVVAASTSAQSASPEAIASRITAAYAAADISPLAPLLAESITFDGEVAFIGVRNQGRLELHDPTITVRDGEGLEPGLTAATLSSRSMLELYDRMFEQIGRDRFVGVMTNRPWRLLLADREGAPFRHVRPGDYVLSTHFRSDEGPEVLDEAVIFLLRPIGGEYRIVSHIADF